MEPNDVTLEVLKSIRDEVRLTRTDLVQRIDHTNARLDATNARLDEANTRLTQTEVRLATEIVAVASAAFEVRDLLRDHRGDRARIDRLEQRVDVLEKRS